MQFIPMVALFFKPVTIKRALALFKSCNEAIKEGATIKEVIKSALIPTVGAVLGATLNQVVSNLIQIRNTHDDKLPHYSPIVVPEIV